MAPEPIRFEKPPSDKERKGVSKVFDKGLVRALAELSSLGFVLVASTFVFLGLGWLLDHYVGTHPFGVIGGAIVGVVLGMYNLIKIATRFRSEEPTDETKNS